MNTLFDAYLMVDWSAAARPSSGKDSIWFALVERAGASLRLRTLENPDTRGNARDRLGSVLADLLGRGRRVLVGFDFPFGYPNGTAGALGLAGPPWRETWREIVRQVSDRPDNRNNRFDAAERLNWKCGHSEGPFWGHPNGREYKHKYRNLESTKPGYHYGLDEKRLCEHLITGPQPVWKLYGNGSVGGQTLTGLPVVHALRNDQRLKKCCRIWPFETGLKNLEARDLEEHPIVFAEIYPSLVKPRSSKSREQGQVKDALQVQAIAKHMATLDESQDLGALFAGAPALNAGQRRIVEREEAWILGVLAAGTRSGAIDVDVDSAFV